MKKWVIFTFLYLFVFVSVSSAEIIYFKNGRKVVGEIFGQTEYSIKVKVDGIPHTYYMHEIEKIEQEKIKDKAKGTSKEQEAFAFKITEKKEELVARLLDANGVRNAMKDRFQQIISQYPSEAQHEIKNLFKADEIVEILIPIYAKYYTQAELKELIGFYRSPVGAKHLGLTPKIVEESMYATIKYFQDKLPDEDLKIDMPK